MAQRRIIDVSVGITEQLPVWPGDPSIQIERTSLIERGAPANVSRYHLGSHTGTHLDPPFHFIDGAPTVESLDLSVLIGPALVVELPDVAQNVSAADLEAFQIPAGTERLLLKTRNSMLWADERHEFDRGFVAVGRSGAEWLV
ncbi:MAG: cyclase family protein, partial [Chloroflexi bacterium]|nr:cyclase family protein [Chloroflexota bacterium]